MTARPVMGIDPSLKGCAVCICLPGNGLIHKEFKTDPKKFPSTTYRGRKERMLTYLKPLESLCREYAPRLIIIEGYSYGSKAISYPALELASLLRYELEGYADDFAEATPAHLKQFATGKGNSGKAAVVSSLTKRYGLEFRTDNEADAFALAKMAEVVAGYRKPEVQIQGKVAQAIREQIAKDQA